MEKVGKRTGVSWNMLTFTCFHFVSVHVRARVMVGIKVVPGAILGELAHPACWRH